MKKALNIICIYILVCVFCTAALATLFMFNADILSYVTDVPSKLFSLDAFLYGLAISFPLTSSAALFAVVLLMIKNRENQILSLILYLALGAATWLFLIPASLSSLADFESKNVNFRNDVTSAGIFREDESGVFYNSRILEDGTADGFFIDTTGFLGEDGKITSFYNSPANNEPAYPYSDILIKNALEPPKYVTYPLAVYTSLLTAAENSYRNGLGRWLFFASFALALLATYGLQFLSSWRLFSALSVATSQILIVFVNYFYYMGYFPSGLKQLEPIISKIIPAAEENSLILAVNFLIAALLVLFGILTGIYRNIKAKSGRNGEIK